MDKPWLLATSYTVLFAVFLYYKVPVWFLFLALAAYSWYRLFTPHPRSMPRVSSPAPISYGTVGMYPVDGDARDLSHGLYIELLSHPVFIDIREDRLVEAREEQAIQLSGRIQELEMSLRSFLEANPEFAHRRIASIGLHSSDLDRGEVFWVPDGYTLLLGTTFVREVSGAL